jgi:hypothetical protein
MSPGELRATGSLVAALVRKLTKKSTWQKKQIGKI